MRRLVASLLFMIGVVLAFHVVLAIVAPFVPYAIGGLVAVGAFHALYYRKRRW